jgi:DNA-binding transcriptional ArsR family regulator
MTDTELIFIDFNNPDLEVLQIVSQPTRLMILHTLTRTKKVYASNLAEELGLERKITSFHLNALEKVDLVKSEFGLTKDKRPAAVRYYEITPKGTEILEKISEILKRK